MTTITRRDALTVSSSLALSTAVLPRVFSGEQPAESQLRVSTFRFDVTPPLGHSLCGGWITPATTIVDSLEAIGFVIQGAGLPIVICSVDWTGILNQAHVAWRTALAEAAGTEPERVAVQCVHQHDAPFVCLEAQAIVKSAGGLPNIVDLDFFKRCLDSGRQAVERSIKSSMPLTHLATGQATVDRVASNRRIMGLTGQVVSQRGSSSKSPDHHRFPEGLIDPNLKTVALYSGVQKVVSCHYYACHPMSHYGRGSVSSDFCGIARKRLQQTEPNCAHLYFNGCGGNIGAGKYNDGSEAMRTVLADRIFSAMVESEKQLNPVAIRQCHWNHSPILPPTRSDWDIAAILKQIHDPSRSTVDRNRPAYTVAWHRRFEQQIPIILSSLNINEASLVHLPAECFVEYQLRAQASFPERFVACAAYGDGGPWYIPVHEAYSQAGYEPSVAWCDPQIDSILSTGISQIVHQS